jgi:hypothetical protein
MSASFPSRCSTGNDSMFFSVIFAVSSIQGVTSRTPSFDNLGVGNSESRARARARRI